VIRHSTNSSNKLKKCLAQQSKLPALANRQNSS
jgi:hypothetical protein